MWPQRPTRGSIISADSVGSGGLISPPGTHTINSCIWPLCTCRTTSARSWILRQPFQDYGPFPRSPRGLSTGLCRDPIEKSSHGSIQGNSFSCHHRVYPGGAVTDNQKRPGPTVGHHRVHPGGAMTGDACRALTHRPTGTSPVVANPLKELCLDISHCPTGTSPVVTKQVWISASRKMRMKVRHCYPQIGEIEPCRNTVRSHTRGFIRTWACRAASFNSICFLGHSPGAEAVVQCRHDSENL